MLSKSEILSTTGILYTKYTEIWSTKMQDKKTEVPAKILSLEDTEILCFKQNICPLVRLSFVFLVYKMSVSLGS